MGLDWTIVFNDQDRAAPNRAYKTTDIETIEHGDYIPAEGSSDAQLEASGYDQPWSFRAQEITLIDELSDQLQADFFRDMAPPQMAELAADLDREAARLEDTLSGHEATVLSDASNWLSYWAEENHWVFACY